MIVIGDRQIQIEDLPWYVVVPGLYIITVIFGIIFEQYPRLMMQPSPHDGSLQCAIYREISIIPHGNYLNVTLNASALNDISVNQSWMSIRLRVSGRLATEVLRNSDAINVRRLSKTSVSCLYETSLEGAVDVELFCSDVLLYSTQLTMPKHQTSKYTYFTNNSIHNVCLSNGNLKIFSQKLVSPAAIYQYTNTIERADPSRHKMSNTKLLFVKIENSEWLDALASAIHTVAVNEGTKGVVFGDIAGYLAEHPLFISDNTTETCTEEVKIADNIKDVRNFDAHDYDLVRDNLLDSPYEPEKSLVLEMNESIQIEEFKSASRLHLSDLSGELILKRFGRVETLVIPFNAPPGLFAFIPKHVRIIVAKPRSVSYTSPLEEKGKLLGVQIIAE